MARARAAALSRQESADTCWPAPLTPARAPPSADADECPGPAAARSGAARTWRQRTARRKAPRGLGLGPSRRRRRPVRAPKSVPLCRGAEKHALLRARAAAGREDARRLRARAESDVGFLPGASLGDAGDCSDENTRQNLISSEPGTATRVGATSARTPPLFERCARPAAAARRSTRRARAVARVSRVPSSHSAFADYQLCGAHARVSARSPRVHAACAHLARR